jgi:hypothetical protein
VTIHTRDQIAHTFIEEERMRPFAAILFALTLMCGAAFATPPDSISLTFDPATHILASTIYHSVRSNPSEHFIAKAVIDVNGAVMVTQTFKSQTDTKVQEVSYVLVDVKEGDKVGLTAVCSLFGQSKQVLVVAPPQPAPGTGTK